MNVGRTAVLCLTAALAAPGGWSQGWNGGGVSDQYLERQQEQSDQQVENRIAEIEKRFIEEQAFRAKMKDQRVGFERKLGRERKAFLDSLKSMKPEDRRKVSDAFYGRLRDKRNEFNEQRRAESRKFWEARIPQRQDAGRSFGPRSGFTR